MVPNLYTDRLSLRAPQKEDLDNIHLLGSDPEVMRYISYGKTQTLEAARRDLNKRIRLSKGNTGYWITEEKESGRFVGWMALKTLGRSSDYEIGYRLMRNMWGKGYATEASRCLIRYAFEDLQLEKVLAVCMPENQASRKVMEKVGLQYTGTGKYYNTHCVIYRIDKSDFTVS